MGDFAEHLERERDRSEHTIRAYVGDVRTCLTWCAEQGSGGLPDIELSTLRAWLGSLAAGGAARSTLSRRSAAILARASETAVAALPPAPLTADAHRASSSSSAIR